MPKGKGAGRRKRLERARGAMVTDGKTPAAAAAAQNPFAQHRNAKKKHEVAGRRVKGGERNMVVARSKAHERRKSTLLQEYKQHGKANVFQDRRFGEQVNDMSQEDKLLARLVKARTNQARKKSVFNLNDEEGDTGTVLTHFGRALGGLAAGEGVDMGGDDYDDDLEEDIVQNLHFGGGEGAEMPAWRGKDQKPAWMANQDTNPNRPRTRKEIMMDVIAKAKMHKAQRAKEKRAQEELLEGLDDKSNLDIVRSLLKPRDNKGSEGEKRSYKAMLAERSAARNGAGAASDGAASGDDEDEFSYDRAVRELSQEARGAKPSDRLKSDAEVAREQLEALQKLEKERLARMTMNYGKATISGPTDDDLAENFELDPRLLDSGSGEDSLASSSESDQDLDSDVDEVVPVEEMRSSRSGRGTGADAGSDSDDGSEGGAGAGAGASAGSDADGAADGTVVMPYLLQCPASVSEWAAMVKKYGGTPYTVADMVRRVRTRYSGHLSPENEPNIATLYKTLLGYLCTLKGGSKAAATRTVAIANALLKPLHEMTKTHTAARAMAWQAAVVATHARVSKCLSGGAGNPWLTLGEIMMLRIATHLFPTSDYRHPVLTPAAILVGRCLHQCPLATPGDVAAALATAGLLIEFTTEAGRAAPEVLSTLHGVLAAASAPSNVEAAEGAVTLPALLGSAGLRPLAWMRAGLLKWVTALHVVRGEAAATTSAPAPRAALPLMPLWLVDADDVAASPTACAGLVASSLKLLQRAAEAVSGLDACPELLYPSWMAVQWLLPLEAGRATKKQRKKKKKSKKSKDNAQAAADAPTDPITRTIRDTVGGLDTLMNKANDERGALKLQAEALAPKAITSFDPLFDEDYALTGETMSARADPKAQLRKLQREVRREQKGVARELRKDAQYLAKVRDDEFAARDKEREAKTKEIMSFLEQQQATFNQMTKIGVEKGGGSGRPVGTKADRRKRKRGN